MNPHALLAVLFGLGLGVLAIYAAGPLFEKVYFSKTLACYQFVRIFGTADWTNVSAIQRRLDQLARDTSFGRWWSRECRELNLQLLDGCYEVERILAQQYGGMSPWMRKAVHTLAQLYTRRTERLAARLERRAQARLTHAQSVYAGYCYDRPLS